MGVAETYDVIVEPEVGNAYCLYAQNIDRTGFVAGTLTSDAGLVAAIPEMDPAPILGHGDMGMDHSSMDHGSMDHGAIDHGAMDHGSMEHGAMEHDAMEHGAMEHEAMEHGAMDHGSMEHGGVAAVGLAGHGSQTEIKHIKTEFGSLVHMRAEMPQNG